ncbi:MAG: glycosyltransferase, partial [Litorimonas sp.]
MTEITIVIPTFRRPADLDRLLDSIAADIGDRTDVAIVVADNDAVGSARTVVQRFADRAEQAVEYRIAPEPGVSNARNKGMESVESRYVLFLDDDMEVVPPYLDPLLDASRRLGTGLTFAPAVARLPDGAESVAEWLIPLFSRVLPGDTRIVSETLGTGGCLVDLQGLSLSSPVFDPELNEVGGEDDAFFAALIAQGARVGWCAEATAWE